MYLYNGTIYTVTKDVVTNGYLKVENDKIVEIGKMSDLKAQMSSDDINLNNQTVYPGFIDSHTHIGMWEDGLNFEGDDGNEDTDPITPQLRAIDAINPMDRCFEDSYQAGVTAVVTGPGSANPIAGQMVAMKTYGKRIDNMILKEPLAIKFALGENPKTVYNGKNETPVTRMAIASLIRETLTKAKRYMDDIKKAYEDEDYDEPEYDMKLEALMPLLKKEIKAHIHCHRADDMFTAIRIAKEFELDYVIVHGTESGLIAQELKEENANIFLGPILCDRAKPEMKNLTPKTPSVIASVGLKPTLVTDHPVIPIQYLPLCAGLAVREGMSFKDALEAITINPAKICGLDSKIGSLEVGKDADLSVFEGNPLSLEGKPSLVMINGKVVYSKN